MLFAMSKSNPNAAVGLIVVCIAVNRRGGCIIVANITLDLKRLDHMPGDRQFQGPR